MFLTDAIMDHALITSDQQITVGLLKCL